MSAESAAARSEEGSATSPPGQPVLVSFCGGDRYYYEAAERLRGDCERVGLEHDIVELPRQDGLGWLELCRRKVPFLQEMHRKHRRPIFWLDVDSRLSVYPDALRGASCDIAAFLRGTVYLRGFDPLRAPRFFAPYALYFNATPAATEFLDLMARLERSHGGSATDDFFLHEAWLRHARPLAIMILPPDIVGREWPLRPGQSIYVGISGNVSAHKRHAEQHESALFAPARRKAVLLNEASLALKSGRSSDALVLMRLASALDPTDDALAERVARLSARETR